MIERFLFAGRGNEIRRFLVCLALITSVPSFAQHIGQLEPNEKAIDLSFLPKIKIDLTCNFLTMAQAQECVRSTLPSIQYRADHYVAQQATMLVNITHEDPKPDGPAFKPQPSVGTAFLVDKEKGLFVTAKHVLIGDTAWSTLWKNNNGFADLESAIEAYLQSDNARINLSQYQDAAPSRATLIALSRTADLALLSVRNIGSLPVTQHPSLFKHFPFPDRHECGNISAIGFSIGPTPGQYVQGNTSPFVPATCNLVSKTYFIGGQKYSFPLYFSSALFEPGFSGGPVLNEQLELVGVVSGATTSVGEKKLNYFVPAAVVKAFVASFR